MRWQPDLRELDAYERRNETTNQAVGGYGPGGDRLSPKESITHQEEN